MKPTITILNKDLDFQLENLVSKLKRRQINGSFEVTIEIAKLFRIIISGGRWAIPKDLYDICNEVQGRLNNAHQVEFAVDTTMKRICTLIEEENTDYMAQSDSVDELNENDMDEDFRDVVKPLLLQGLTELIDETELSSSNISNQAFDHIHSSEIIMTLGYSIVVADFLKEAAKFRKFQVLVAETAPEYKLLI
jgi:translation initiation factor eIF-2B subunit beta